jgi:hypothetical protein
MNLLSLATLAVARLATSAGAGMIHDSTAASNLTQYTTPVNANCDVLDANNVQDQPAPAGLAGPAGCGRPGVDPPPSATLAFGVKGTIPPCAGRPLPQT